MRPLIDKGHLYLACPPLYRLTQGARRLYVADDAEKEKWMEKGLGGKGKIDVQRFKGLGEMTAEQLWETTLKPDTRRLLRVSFGDTDAAATTLRFTMLMGKGEAAARRGWLEEHGNEVEVDV
jgi:topoisomerase-4 subunit B